MPRESVAGGIAIVVDVLRASTTIVTALEEGAAFVKPVSGVDEARRLKHGDFSSCLLGGERGGLRIAGFDLGNSPAEYTHSVVAGRGVLMTTTNGTLAIERCEAAREILVGSFVNRTSVARSAFLLASKYGIDAIHLVCAGTDGEETDEDILGAGAIVDAGIVAAKGHSLFDPCSQKASFEFLRVINGSGDSRGRLAARLRQSLGGKNLIRLGMDSDLILAAAVDRCRLVPYQCSRTGTLMSFDDLKCIDS
ncbi:MAG: 2-phosphosulfolactate phosphatase [Planctomycetaceae bacterium]|nr:2-phosphosulfolactate phosphatase [Planctomycetaceae bacterium]